MSYWRNKRVAITGGAGFLGSNLALKLLELGARVTLSDSLDRDYGGNLKNLGQHTHEFELIIGDLAQEKIARRAIDGAEIIFDLAGQSAHLDSMKNPQKDLRNNVSNRLELIRAWEMAETTPRVIYASTRQVYGRPNQIPVSEEHPTNPVDVNGVNKLAAEMHLLRDYSQGNSRVTVLRLTNCFGPRMRVRDSKQTFLGLWIRNALRGLPITIFGNGNQNRDFLYSDDVVSAMISVAKKDATIGKILNLGGTETFSLSEVARELSCHVGGSKIEFRDFPADLQAIDIGSFTTDSRLLRNLTGWNAKTSFSAGLRETVEYYRRNGSHYGV